MFEKSEAIQSRYRVKMTSVTVVVNNILFHTTKEILTNSGYFKGIFELNPDETLIVIQDRCDKLFRHVLYYLQDNMYPFPSIYYEELEFYLVEKDLHACEVRHCLETSVRHPNKQFSYCIIHICRHATCENKATQGHHYCDIHLCQRTDCEYGVLKSVGTIKYNYCDEHACQNRSCRQARMINRYYCACH